ncbi:MAG: BrnT family toxin [Gemmatimonadaceae bacterium]
MNWLWSTTCLHDAGSRSRTGFSPRSRRPFDPGSSRRTLCHSVTEERFALLGLSVRGRLLTIMFTERGERVRIISARRATKSERCVYEEVTGQDRVNGQSGRSRSCPNVELDQSCDGPYPAFHAVTARGLLQSKPEPDPEVRLARARQAHLNPQPADLESAGFLLFRSYRTQSSCLNSLYQKPVCS